jgi:hypothetical protein
VTEVRILAATGVIGAGFKVESLNRGIALAPTFIACDADPARPNCLGRHVRATCACF